MQHIHLDFSWYTPYTGDTRHLYGVADWVTTLNGNTDSLNTPRPGIRTHGTWHSIDANCARAVGGQGGTWLPLTTPLGHMCSCLNGHLFAASGKTRRQRQPSTETHTREQLDALTVLYYHVTASGALDIANTMLEQHLLRLGEELAAGRLLFPQLAETLTAALAATATRREAHLVVSSVSVTRQLPTLDPYLNGAVTIPADLETLMCGSVSYLDGWWAADLFACPDVFAQASYLDGTATIDDLLGAAARQGNFQQTGNLALEHAQELYRHFLTAHLDNLTQVAENLAGRYALMRTRPTGGNATQVALRVARYEYAQGRCSPGLVLVPLAVVAMALTRHISSGDAAGHNYIEVPAGTRPDDDAVRTAASIDDDETIPLPEIWECAQTLTAQR
jgi:hypothetical protein